MDIIKWLYSFDENKLLETAAAAAAAAIRRDKDENRIIASHFT